MSKKPDKPDKSNAQEASSTPTFSEADKGKAQKWFKRAQELVEVKNYDYAIEAFINGLGFWPEAIDQGHKPCRAASLFRGKKKKRLGRRGQGGNSIRCKKTIL